MATDTTHLISEGSYMARGTSLALINSTNKNTPGATVVFAIADEGPFKGKLIEWTGWLTEKTADRTAESLEFCGFDGKDEKTISKNLVQIVIEHETYAKTDEENGTEKVYVSAKVRWVNDPGRARTQFKPMDDVQKNEAMATLRGLVLAKKQAREQSIAAGAQGSGSSFDFGANAPSPPPNVLGAPDQKVKF
jgi:hypothetical protein